MPAYRYSRAGSANVMLLWLPPLGNWWASPTACRTVSRPLGSFHGTEEKEDIRMSTAQFWSQFVQLRKPRTETRIDLLKTCT
ncbi:hypothetical protein J6590_030425 [Homalodisca vitripennis]|nr:hypothetical protein J6590_030425 [Homalodisca vitripennis]